MQDSQSQGKTSSKLSESMKEGSEYDSPEENGSKISKEFDQAKIKQNINLVKRRHEKQIKNLKENIRTNRRNRRTFTNGPNRIQRRVRGGQRANKRIEETNLSDDSDSSSISSIEESMRDSLSLCNDSVTEHNKKSVRHISEQSQKKDVYTDIKDPV